MTLSVDPPAPRVQILVKNKLIHQVLYKVQFIFFESHFKQDKGFIWASLIIKCDILAFNHIIIGPPIDIPPPHGI